MANIGFIGLGHMGSPMIGQLLKNHHVTVYDINTDAMNAASKQGAFTASNPQAVASNASFVFTMLQTGEQVRSVCLGEKGIFNHLSKEALFIDCSSIKRSDSLELHEMAYKTGIQMLDAPVSGGVKAATNSMLTFMVGGNKTNFNKAYPILNCMGKNIIHAGEAGAGCAAKICNNMILGISMIAVSEAFLLADRMGLDPHKLYEISTKASGNCWSLSEYCPWPGILSDAPSSHDYQAGFTAQMMLKDLNLSQLAAKDANLNTPLGNHAQKLYQQFIEKMSPEIDFSAIIKMINNFN